MQLLQSQTPSTDVSAKLAALRSLLVAQNVDAYLIPSADEHLNEYLPEAKQRRKWISGFTGSAGDFLVGQEQSWLFADSRYYEQAELETDASLIQVSKVGLDDHKTLEETLEALGREAVAAGKTLRLGYDPFTLSIHQFRELQKRLEPCGVVLVAIADNLVDQVREQQPWADAEPAADYASSKLFYLSETFTGESVEEKLERLREKLKNSGTDILPITKLDQIAWLFNLRGWDVPYNPVFIAYAIVTAKKAFLFTNLNRIAINIHQALEPYVTLLPYAQYAGTLKSLLTPSSWVLIDPKRTTMGTYQLLKSSAGRLLCKISETANPIEGMKARKNATEIEQMQQANLQASRAKTRTIYWIMQQLAAGQSLTEAEVAATVERNYAEEADFQGLSFNTIAGSGANSSIVHYGTPNPEKVLQPGEFLLLDSGAQYASGTTDDTRTIVIGDPTPEQIERYTEVLKAHINCAMQKFPKGTTGAQLDGITRSTLWYAGLDYGHGTGHGVGAFLNVHEGPNGISKRVSEPLEPGMVTSIEPGYYKPGWGGIRIENLYVVKELPKADNSSDNEDALTWYGFESLTYIPFDQRLIDCDRLDARQRQWLEAYYQTVLDKLTPLLNAAEAAWLHQICSL
ncbi:aminopeptidase P family protein [Leptodesmis sichuanensis]|uniref:aminopeptidase P family protein n=1 Tax=Leptodesmis sichuanensis TaxID=2906798 RepID=UPI001F315F49|nr:aminopeptidase P family protein [Leptodesmis sichuanensis]UIE39512.1 aminopeptidase P family protein [Leptodesmis sichuanensis A121]